MRKANLFKFLQNQVHETLLNMNQPRRPQLVLSSEDEEFDPATVQHWNDEGFQVLYLPCTTEKSKEMDRTLQELSDQLELGEHYAIVGLLST